MLMQMFLQTIAKAVMATGLAAGVMEVGAMPAVGQMLAPGQSSPASAQQAIYAFTASLSPYEQQLVLKALRKLGPRAGAEVARLVQMNLVAPGILPMLGPRVITPALQSIRPEYHQAFVDGVFKVSQPEELFAMQVISRLMQTQQTQAGFGPQQLPTLPQAMGSGNLGSDADPITPRDIWKWSHDLNRDRIYMFERGQNRNPGFEMP